jgi:hypothetical protein
LAVAKLRVDCLQAYRLAQQGVGRRSIAIFEHKKTPASLLGFVWQHIQPWVVASVE